MLAILKHPVGQMAFVGVTVVAAVMGLYAHAQYKGAAEAKEKQLTAELVSFKVQTIAANIVAQGLELQLTDMRAKYNLATKELKYEVRTQVVYRECRPTDNGVRLYNDIRTGSAAR